MKIKRILFSIALFLMFFIISNSAANAAWDFYEDWESGTLDQKITSSTSPWSATNSYSGLSSYGAHYDNYYARYKGKYSCHMGPITNEGSSYYYRYLYRSLGSATPVAGKMKFWAYLYYARLWIDYTTSSSISGASWSTAYTVASGSTYIYGQVYTVTIPAGARFIRFRGYSRLYDYYGIWLDNIDFHLPYATVTDITGYDEGVPNMGQINFSASVSATSGYTLSKVVWQYKTSLSSTWTTFATDTSSSGGWTGLFDPDALNQYDHSMGIRACAYVTQNTYPSKYRVEYVNVQAMTVGSCIVDSPMSGLTKIKIPVDIPSGVGGVFPPNEWEYRYPPAYYNTYMNYLDYSRPIPFGGTATNLNVNWVARIYSSNSTSYVFYFKLWKANANGTYTQVATTGSMTYGACGEHNYALSGATWANLPSGLLIGAWLRYGYVYSSSGAPYTGNGTHQYKFYSSSTVLTGTTSSFSTGTPSTNSSLPFRVSFKDCPGGTLESALCRYKIGTQGEYVNLGEMEYEDGVCSLDWESWRINTDELYIEFKFDNGIETDWYVFGPYTVYNKVDVTFNTNLDGESAGKVTVNGVDYDAPATVQFNYFEDVEFSVPQYIFNSNDKRYRWDYWEDGGEIGKYFETIPYCPTSFTANFSRQYWFGIDCVRPERTGTDSGWYEPGTPVKFAVEEFSIVAEGQERYQSLGYEIPVFGISTFTSEIEYAFELNQDVDVKIWWQRQFFFEYTGDRSTAVGDVQGWYQAESHLNITVADFFPNGSGARLRCSGYTFNGVRTYDEYQLSFVLSQYTNLEWFWVQQYLVNCNTNIGTITPETGWFDEGTEVPVTATALDSNEWTRYSFTSWDGSGSGAIDATGGEPICTITVNSPITENAFFTIEYFLQVNDVNGTLNAEVEGWYVAGTEVHVSTTSPAASANSRYIISWDSPSECGYNSQASIDAPSAIVITMAGPVAQGLEWHLQHLLTIANESGLDISIRLQARTGCLMVKRFLDTVSSTQENTFAQASRQVVHCKQVVTHISRES